MGLGLGYDVTSKIMIVETLSPYFVKGEIELQFHAERDKPSVELGWSDSGIRVPGFI